MVFSMTDTEDLRYHYVLGHLPINGSDKLFNKTLRAQEPAKRIVKFELAQAS